MTPTPLVKEESNQKPDPWAKLGGGNTLRVKESPVNVKSPPAHVIDATMLDEDDFAFGDDGKEYDDVIEIDSD